MKSWKEFVVVVAVCAVVVAVISSRTQQPESKEGGYTPRLITKDYEPARHDLVLVQLDKSAELTTWSTEAVAGSTGARVARLVDLSGSDILGTAYNDSRKQYDGDKLLAALSDVKRESNEKILALTREDLYLSSVPEWRYCFGSHGPDVAVLSSVRMGGRFQDELFPSEKAEDRFRKMLFRYVIEMCYGLPRNSRPESLLYERILAPRHLDTVQYKI